MPFLLSQQSEAMRTSEFDSSSEDEEVGEEQLTPFHVSWLVPAVFDLCDQINVCLNVKQACLCLCLYNFFGWFSGYLCPQWSARSFSGYVHYQVKSQFIMSHISACWWCATESKNVCSISLQVASTKISAGVWREMLVRRTKVQMFFSISLLFLYLLWTRHVRLRGNKPAHQIMLS